MQMKWLAAALAVVSTSAQAENWRISGGTDEFPAVIAFVDTDSVRRAGDTVEFIVQYFGESDSPTTDERFLQRWRGSCSAANYKILSNEHYIGTILQPYQPPTDQTIASIPNGLDQASIYAACGTASYVTEKIDNPVTYAADFFDDLAYEAGW